MNNLANDIKQRFIQGNAVSRIVIINLALFLILWCAEVICGICKLNIYPLSYLAAPTSTTSLLLHPWTLFTSMFTHTRFLSLFCNLLVFYWMGNLYSNFFNGKHTTAMYILSGIAGIALATTVATLTHQTTHALLYGATAPVIGTLVATAIYAPNYTVLLAFVGEVKLKTIAILFVVIECLPVLDMAGYTTNFLIQTHAFALANIGGILYGATWALLKKQGIDIQQWIVDLATKLTPSSNTHKNRHTPDYGTYVDYEEVTPTSNEEMDRILNKIQQQGYDSLTDEEKHAIFNHKK